MIPFRTTQGVRAMLALTLATAMAACETRAEPEVAADLVLRNGRIVTVDESMPEAQAIAMKGDTILAVGTDADIDAFVGEATEVIDLGGMLAVPGLIESHGHFFGIGDANLQLDLMDVTNWEQIVDMVAAAATDIAEGQLIRGRGWHQEKWDRVPENAVEGLPTHDALSAVSPANPVVLRHASGHASFANARAMEMAGITRDTPNPPGGEIVKGPDGEPIGMFRETAQGLLRPASANATPPDPRQQAELAIEELLAKGITSFHDAGSGFDDVALLKRMADEGALGVRMYVMLRVGNDELARRMDSTRVVGYGDDHVTVRAIKRSIDGALGPHGAWLLEPYEDLPSSAGLNTSEVASIEETARLAIEHDYQLNVHAIGDRANREVLDIFERTFAAHPQATDLRWRIEHAQHLHPTDIPRFAELGVIAAMQGIHATSDAPYVLERLGEDRAREGAYVWQSLIESGAVVVNGTDAPVEDVDPIASFYATVSRRTADGSVFFAEQRMTREQALRSYTLDAAYAAFEEDIKGSLTPGKLADVTVLTRDIMSIPEEEIPTTEVAMTIVGGRVAYRRPEN